MRSGGGSQPLFSPFHTSSDAQVSYFAVSPSESWDNGVLVSNPFAGPSTLGSDRRDAEAGSRRMDIASEIEESGYQGLFPCA